MDNIERKLKIKMSGHEDNQNMLMADKWTDKKADGQTDGQRVRMDRYEAD